MCAYSNISDWGRSQYYPVTPTPTYPMIITPAPPEDPMVRLTKKDWEAFKKLLAAAKKFDAETGQPDCESATKTAWMKEVEERLAGIEEKLT